MKTINVGIKEFRAHMPKWFAEASKKNQTLILFKNNTPMFELRMLTRQEQEEAELLAAIERAKDDFRNGRTYTAEEVLANIKKRHQKR